MANSVGSVTIDLEARIAKFESDLGRAARVAEQRSKEARASWGKVAALIGSGVSVAAFVSQLKNAVNQMDELSKSAQRAGVTTEVFSSLNYAAKLADVSTEDLTGTLGKLIKNMGMAQYASSQQAQVFKALGISTTDATGKIRDSVDVLKEFADRFKDLKGDPDAIAAGMALFGKSFQNVIPLLKDGAQGISDAQEEADRLNQTISGEAGKAAEQFNDNITRLQSVSLGFFNVLAEKLLPALDDWTDDVVALASDHDKLNDAVSGISNTLEILAAIAHAVAAGFKVIAASVSSVAVVAAEMVNQLSLLKDSISHPFDQAALASDNAKAIAGVQNLKDSLSGIWTKATDGIDASFDAASKNIARVKGEIVDLPKAQAAAGASNFIDGVFGPDGEAQKRADSIRKALHGALADPTGSLAAAAASKASAAAAKLKAAYDGAFNSLQQKIASDKEALDVGTQVTAAEKSRAQLIQQMDSGVLKVTASQRAYLLSLADTDVQLQKDIALQKQRAAGMAAIVSLTDSITSSMQNQIDQNDISKIAIGHGAEVAKQLQDELNIRIEYQRKMRDINKLANLPENVGTTLGVGGDAYNQQIEIAKRAQDVQTDLYRQGIEDRKKLEADGMNGVRSAMEDFMTQQQNMAAQMKEFTTNAISGFSDAFAAFASGSESAKKAFGSMIDSMYQQALKFIANKAIQAFFDSFGNGDNQTKGTTNGGWGSLISNFASYFSSTGGGHAIGGMAYANTVSPINENGPEVFTYNNRDYLATGNQNVKVTPITQSRNYGGNTSVTNVYVQPSSTRRTADQVAQAVDRKQRVASSRNG